MGVKEVAKSILRDCLAVLDRDEAPRETQRTASENDDIPF